MKNAKALFKTLISAVYPNKCICCGEILDEVDYICDNCNVAIERINLDDICLDCGCEKEDCVCKYNVFRFNAIVSAFKNTGLARRAYYSYKFGKKQHYANFFADEICRTIKNCYDGTRFDVVCAVPLYQRFGYDHSGYVAELVAEKLSVPFDNKLLFCVKKSKNQHKSTIKERLRNVDGKYSVNCRLDNKNILLIDDIKTTGATLDECAKMLLFAGADSVYCATALGTTEKSKNKN